MKLSTRVAALLSVLFLFSAINDNPHQVGPAVLVAALLLLVLWLRRWIKGS